MGNGTTLNVETVGVALAAPAMATMGVIVVMEATRTKIPMHVSV
jgi:hypothetical protein